MHHQEAAHHAVELTWHFWCGIAVFVFLLFLVIYVLDDFINGDGHE